MAKLLSTPPKIDNTATARKQFQLNQLLMLASSLQSLATAFNIFPYSSNGMAC
jgi:hypothetical protein